LRRVPAMRAGASRLPLISRVPARSAARLRALTWPRKAETLAG
jgi:hypothetical protein